MVGVVSNRSSSPLKYLPDHLADARVLELIGCLCLMINTVVQCDGIEGRKGMIGSLDHVHGQYPTKNTLDRLIHFGNIQSNSIIPADECRYKGLICRAPLLPALRTYLRHMIY